MPAHASMTMLLSTENANAHDYNNSNKKNRIKNSITDNSVYIFSSI